MGTWSRREFMRTTGATAGVLGLSGLDAGALMPRQDPLAEFEEYMKRVAPSPQHIEYFLSRQVVEDEIKNNKGWTYDAELGWVVKNASKSDGVHGSRTYFHYDPDGSRRTADFFPGQAARIQSFGDSFTHCDQVNDGETWQRYLGSHLCEPILNYGVGGYSVYQAFLRYQKVQKTHPAEFIILNIWSDDHFRNLDSLRSMRFGSEIPDCFTLPHLRVDRARQECRPQPNPCPTPDDVRKLADMGFLKRTFYEDPGYRLFARTRRDDLAWNLPAVSVGLVQARLDVDEETRDLISGFTRDALFATMKVVDWMEKDITENGRKLLVILSHDENTIERHLRGEPCWDQDFLDYLKGKSFPVVDLRETHQEDFAESKLEVEPYVRKYYIGHYAPAGNFFCAQAIRQAVVDWLDPKPAPYR